MKPSSRFALIRGRRDANDAALSCIPPKLGVYVADTSGAGNGIPDKLLLTLIGVRDVACWCEIKDGSKPVSAQRLTDKEYEFFVRWFDRMRCAVVGNATQTADMCLDLKSGMEVREFNLKWLAPALRDYRDAAKRRAERAERKAMAR